jgi:iron complex outermembrane recepter protein
MAGSNTLWAAVSRAVRTPARYEHTFYVETAVIPTPQPGLLGVITLDGNPSFVSEEVLDYEVGFRAQPDGRLSFDVVGFFNEYDHLSSIEPSGVPGFVPFPFPHLEIPQTFGNLTSGSGYGTELVFNLLPLDPWRLQVSYSYMRLDLKRGEGSLDSNVEGPEGNFPQNQFRVQSYLDLSRRFQLDANLQYVDELPTQGTPSYTRFDMRFAFRPSEQVELALVGQNLLDDRHFEFNQAQLPAVASLVERSVLVQVRWRR